MAHFILDERTDVSYPDAIEDNTGKLWFVYDHDRSGAKEILMGCLTEDDILAGQMTTPGSFPGRVVDRAGSEA